MAKHKGFGGPQDDPVELLLRRFAELSESTSAINASVRSLRAHLEELGKLAGYVTTHLMVVAGVPRGVGPVPSTIIHGLTQGAYAKGGGSPPAGPSGGPAGGPAASAPAGSGHGGSGHTGPKDLPEDQWRQIKAERAAAHDAEVRKQTPGPTLNNPAAQAGSAASVLGPSHAATAKAISKEFGPVSSAFVAFSDAMGYLAGLKGDKLTEAVGQLRASPAFGPLIERFGEALKDLAGMSRTLETLLGGENAGLREVRKLHAEVIKPGLRKLRKGGLRSDDPAQLEAATASMINHTQQALLSLETRQAHKAPEPAGPAPSGPPPASSPRLSAPPGTAGSALMGPPKPPAPPGAGGGAPGGNDPPGRFFSQRSGWRDWSTPRQSFPAPDAAAGEAFDWVRWAQELPQKIGMGFMMAVGGSAGLLRTSSPDAYATVMGSFKVLAAEAGKSLVKPAAHVAAGAQDLTRWLSHQPDRAKDMAGSALVYGTLIAGGALALSKFVLGLNAAAASLHSLFAGLRGAVGSASWGGVGRFAAGAAGMGLGGFMGAQMAVGLGATPGGFFDTAGAMGGAALGAYGAPALAGWAGRGAASATTTAGKIARVGLRGGLVGAALTAGALALPSAPEQDPLMRAIDSNRNMSDWSFPGMGGGAEKRHDNIRGLTGQDVPVSFWDTKETIQHKLHDKLGDTGYELAQQKAKLMELKEQGDPGAYKKGLQQEMYRLSSATRVSPEISSIEEAYNKLQLGILNDDPLEAQYRKEMLDALNNLTKEMERLNGSSDRGNLIEERKHKPPSAS